MTTNNDARTPLSPQESQPKEKRSMSTDNKKQATPPSTSNKSRGFYIAVTITIVAIIASSSSLYLIKTSLQLRQSMEQQTQNLVTQLRTLKQQQSETQAQFDTSISTISESQQKLQDQLNAVNKHLQSTLQQRSYQTNDWLLLKARYCLELAQINTHWSDNWQTTLALLQQADTILTNTHDQQVFKIRQAIAKEMIQLRSMPTIDLPGLLSQLDAALDMTRQLPLKPMMAPIDRTNQITQTGGPSSSTWRQRLKDSTDILERLIVVRHHDDNVLPLPSPAYESLLRESIRLYLQEAQWAVLQANEAVYQFSLAKAMKKINVSFAPNVSETTIILKQLQDLQKVHLIQPKPILDQALPLLNQLIESNDKTKMGIKSTSAGENS